MNFKKLFLILCIISFQNTFSLTVGEKAYKGFIKREDVKQMQVTEFYDEEDMTLNENAILVPVEIHSILENSIVEVIDSRGKIEKVHLDYIYQSKLKDSLCLEKLCVGDNTLYDNDIFPMYQHDILKIVDIIPELDIAIIGIGFNQYDYINDYIPLMIPAIALQKLKDCASSVCKGDSLSYGELESIVVIGATDKGDFAYSTTSSRDDINLYYSRVSYYEIANLNELKITQRIKHKECNDNGTICLGDMVIRKVGLDSKYKDVLLEGGIVTGIYENDRIEYSVDSRPLLEKIESLYYAQPRVPVVRSINDESILNYPVIVENTLYSYLDLENGIVKAIFGLAYSDDLVVIK